MTVIKAAPGVWCDYCKVRWGTDNTLGRKPASYTVVSAHPKSKGHNRHYCHACALEVQEWTNGESWSIVEQAEYLLKQEELPDYGSI